MQQDREKRSRHTRSPASILIYNNSCIAGDPYGVYDVTLQLLEWQTVQEDNDQYRSITFIVWFCNSIMFLQIPGLNYK